MCAQIHQILVLKFGVFAHTRMFFPSLSLEVAGSRVDIGIKAGPSIEM